MLNMHPSPPPLTIQPEERIQTLKAQLDDPVLRGQRTNILAAIQLYETGQLGPITGDGEIT